MNQRPHILVIEDDVEIRSLLRDYLAREGFRVDVGDGGAALDRFRATLGEPDLVVLDIMLPGEDGLSICRRLRAGSRVPILMLTAKGEDIDRIVGLEMGADDYLPKPFNPQELAARIRAILRRAQPADEKTRALSPPIIVGDVEMNLGTRVVRRGGETVNLTTVEFDLLEVLLRAAGQVVDREKLTRDVLGREFSPFDRSIDTHVCNLRKKIGLLEDGTERIKGVRGIGYLYAQSYDR